MSRNDQKSLQLVTVLMGVMVPVVILMAIIEQWYLFGVVVVVELAFIAWSVALVSKTRATRR